MLHLTWYKSLKFNPRNGSVGDAASEGFTLVEILVSMIITMVFLAITLQIFMTAAYLRVKATEYDDAYNWVQEDFEQILTRTKRYEMQAVPFSSHCSAGTLASSFITDNTDGLGGETTDLGERTVGGQIMQLTRSASHLGTLDPKRLINVSYLMINRKDGQTVLDITTKVTIYAAFNCPS